MDRDTARGWIERWDRQQEESLPDREDRFTALIDAVEEGTGRADPVVLDIGCGPGSLAVRLLGRLPRATVIAIDADPVTLTLGQAAYGDLPGLRFVDLDLRVPGWSATLGLERPADAAVSTTALHWLPEPDLRAMYAELAAALRPGALLLDGDHFSLDSKETPTLARLDLALRQREDLRRFPDGHGEGWHAWWEAAAADPVLAGPAAQRKRRHVDSGHHGSESNLLATHVEALRAAGFAEIGTLWQRGDNRLLCGVLAPRPEPTTPLGAARVGNVHHPDDDPDQRDEHHLAEADLSGVSRMQDGRGGTDGKSHRAEGEDHRARPDPSGRRGAPRQSRRGCLRVQLAEQPCGHRNRGGGRQALVPAPECALRLTPAMPAADRPGRRFLLAN